ncbi:DUF983 domain-containing protein [Pseudoroseomonas globiformis]|uniref:DUF983 domain-containing protein n=1 Tax=Teichococcus globiformis TaxID=2307229 RepID=A0ABV7FZ44_9PROT
MERPPQRWEPARGTAVPPGGPSFTTMVLRGARNRCPICGEGHVFQGYLRIVPECSVCHAPLGRVRADDAPPYFTLFIVAHILVPPIFWIEKAYQPPMWLHMVVWLPLFALICVAMLRPVKGAVLGWMLRLGITGDPHGESQGDYSAAQSAAPPVPGNEGGVPGTSGSPVRPRPAPEGRHG